MPTTSSPDFGPRYRQAAEGALGRPLKTHEVVHHHTATQLVICDRGYHGLLHQRMRERGISNPVLPWRTEVSSRSIRISDAAYAKLTRMAAVERRTITAVFDRLASAYFAKAVQP